MFGGKCLCFNGYTKQAVVESPIETYRVRRVKILYFLVDDTISVMEPVVEVCIFQNIYYVNKLL